MIIGNKQIGKGSSCYLIAEIGHNHQGNLNKALELIRQAAVSGADAVKLQKRSNKTLFTKDFYNKPYQGKNSFGSTYGEHREHLELSIPEIKECKSLADQLEIDFLLTPFDEQSLQLCLDLELAAIKIASGDLTNHPFLEQACKLDRPILLSTGGSTLSEIELAYQKLLSLGGEFALLYTVSSYPTLPHQVNLIRLKEQKELFPGSETGYSGHDEGIMGALLARSHGAVIIEKHFTLDKTLKGTDHGFSLTPSEFRSMRDELKRIDQIMGSAYPSHDLLNDHEKEARHKMGKGIYAADNIPTGTVITEDLLCIKSPSNELTPAEMGLVIGKQTRVELKKEEPLKRSSLT